MIAAQEAVAILTLLMPAGEKCERIITKKIRNVQVRDVEVR